MATFRRRRGGAKLPCGHRSKYECEVARQLTAARLSWSYETERLAYEVPAIYTPDFIVEPGIIVEAKGYFPQEDRKKMEHVTRCNPDLDIRMLFTDPFKFTRKGGRETYAAWCEKHGIPWAKGPEWPKEW